MAFHAPRTGNGLNAVIHDATLAGAGTTLSPLTVVGVPAIVFTADSVTGDGNVATPVKLVNDSATPGNSKYYGTDGSGTRGYFAFPDIALPNHHFLVGDNTNKAVDAGAGITYDPSDGTLTIDSTGLSAIPIVINSAGNTTFGVTSTAGQAILNLLPSGLNDSFVTYRTNLIFGTNGGLGGMINDLFQMDNAGNFTAGNVATSVSGTVSLVHGASGNLIQLNAYNGVGTTWQMYFPAGAAPVDGYVLSGNMDGTTYWGPNGGSGSLPNVSIQAYGTTLDLSAGVSTYYDIQFSGSTGAAGLLLPTGTNAPIGTELIIKDLGVSASTNNITVDAGASNFIVGTSSAQTYVLNLNGESIKVRKVSATQWSIE